MKNQAFLIKRQGQYELFIFGEYFGKSFQRKEMIAHYNSICIQRRQAIQLNYIEL